MATSPSTENLTLGTGTVYFQKTGETAWRHVGNVPELEISLSVERRDHFSSMGASRAKDKSVVLTKSGTARMVLEELTPENLELMLMGAPSAAAVNLSTTVDTTNGDATLANLAAVTNLVEGRRYNIVGTASGSPIPADATFVFDGVDGGEMDATADATATATAVTITGVIALEIFGTTEVTGKLRYVGENDVGNKITMELNNVSIAPTGSFNPISDDWLQMEVTGELLADSLGQFGHAYFRGTSTATTVV
jgi:hypothetical protein